MAAVSSTLGDNSVLEQALADDPEETPTRDDGALPDPNTMFDNMEELPEEEAPETAESAAEEAAEEAKKETPEEEPDPQLGQRAQKRIQSLAAEKNKLTEELVATRTQVQQWQQQQQQYLQQMQSQYNQQLQQMRTQMQAAEQAAAAERARIAKLSEAKEEEGLSELEKYERRLLRQAAQQAESLSKQQVAAIQKQLEAERAERARAQKDAERKQRYDHWMNETQRARQTTLFNGFDEADVKDLAEPGDELILTWASAFGEQPEVAAKALRAFADKYADARAKARAKAGKTTPAPKRGLPQSAAKAAVPEQATTKRQTSLPQASREMLHANGYGNYWQWQQAGFPVLKKQG